MEQSKWNYLLEKEDEDGEDDEDDSSEDDEDGSDVDSEENITSTTSQKRRTTHLWVHRSQKKYCMFLR